MSHDSESSQGPAKGGCGEKVIDLILTGQITHRINEALPLPRQGWGIEAENSQRLLCLLRFMLGQPWRGDQFPVLRHESKKTVASDPRLHRQHLPLFVMAAVTRPIAALGEIVVLECQMTVQPFRFDMLYMAGVFSEKSLAIHAKPFLFLIELPPDNGLYRLEILIIPGAMRMLNMILL